MAVHADEGEDVQSTAPAVDHMSVAEGNVSIEVVALDKRVVEWLAPCWLHVTRLRHCHGEVGTTEQ